MVTFPGLGPRPQPLRHVWVFGLLLIFLIPSGPALGSPHPASRTGGNILSSPSQSNVTFTGDPATDFPSGPLYVNTNASAWGANNNLSDLYVAYNSAYLFLGLHEVVTGNSLMIFVGDAGASSQGTYNFAGLNAWNRDITFASPVISFAAVYFGGQNANLSGYNAFEITSPVSASNSSPTDRAIPSLSDFSNTHGAAEVGIPLSYVFPGGSVPVENVTVSAFVVGSTGAWVGTGEPFPQSGQYNAGGSQGTFLVSDTFRLTLSGVAPVHAQPINVALIFNDHQPLYQIAGNDTYNLPWTEAHATAEYIEQAILLREYPRVNITYELSGSLLYQLENISQFRGFNDSFIEGAYIPWSSLNTTQNRTLLATLTGDYFSIPGYVYAFNEPASQLYKQLESQWSSGGTLTASQFEDAKVLWFLYDVSTDLVEGRLGTAWTNSTIWALHNQTTFSQADLGSILTYSQWLTGQVIPAFRETQLGYPGGSDNTELFTSPFYHPLTPLLLTTSMTGPNGTLTKGSYPADVLAQMNLSRDQFDSLFGEYPQGLYASEAAVSESMIPLVDESGAKWTATDEWTLQRSNITAMGYGDSGATVLGMENLYTPYTVEGAGGTSTTVLFRDAPLSNNWAFNYGNLPTATAVSDILNYLKGINSALPESDHAQTLVTIMLDGENWQFMSPFADDGIPFLEELYQALGQNASSVHTVTPSQFLATARASHFPLPVLGHVATGSWNQASGQAAPYQYNPSLTQWSGYSAQNVLWERLDRVRNSVVSFQNNLSLVQLQNLTPFEQNLTANTAEGNLTRAWYGIYNAEGSDWFFQMAPWTILSANTIPFNQTFQGDLNYSLSQLHVPIPTLGSVTVSPANATLPVGGMTQFTATLACTGGTCPSGAMFNWTLANALGSVNASLGPTVTFSAGYAPGYDTLFVNVTLNGVTRQGPPVTISVGSTQGPTLTSVAISPSTATLGVGGTTLPFNATPTCSTACPAGVVYTWALTDLSLGSLNSSTGDSVMFTAGGTGGNDTLSVNATLNGKTVKGPPATITITPAPVPTLSSVSIAPGSVQVPVGTTSPPMTAHIVCHGGMCPNGTTYEWSLSNHLGTINSTAGPSVAFTAGSGPGTVTLTVIAALDGRNVSGSTILTIVPAQGHTPGQSSILGLSPTAAFAVLGIIIAVILAAAILALIHGRGRKPVQAPGKEDLPTQDEGTKGSPPEAPVEPTPESEYLES